MELQGPRAVFPRVSYDVIVSSQANTDYCSQSVALCRVVTGEINVYCSVQMLPERVELFICSLLTLKRARGETEEVFLKQSIRHKTQLSEVYHTGQRK